MASQPESQPPRGESGTTLLTLERGLAVLDAVAVAEGRATAKTLSRSVGLRLSTCYHLLRTLREGGYVVRLPDGTYDVGPQASCLGRRLQQRSGPAPELLAILTRLHTKTGETSYISGWYHGVITLQEYINGLHTLSVRNLDVGYAGLMHARASCKAVLGFLPEQHIEAMFSGVRLEALTARTIVDYDQLVAELTDVRRRGYAVDREEFADGVCCVAAPFFDDGDRPAGAFTVSVPTTRFDGAVTTLTGEVREAAAMASTLLRTGRLAAPSAQHAPTAASRGRAS